MRKMQKQFFKENLRYLLVFLTAAALLIGLLVLAARIPQSAIRENVLESAEFLCKGELFGTVVPDVNGSRIDRYADSILLGIAWQYDSNHPLESVMWSSYYQNQFQNENKNLLDAVTGGFPANQQYLRYWHGSNALLRPLLAVWNLPQIYAFHAVLLAALALWLLGLLLRKKAYFPAVSISAGLVLTASWFVPLSLEYTWTYLVMLAVSLLAVSLAGSGKWNQMGTLFLLSGILTNYLDFLTTETLTLLIPLLLVLWFDLRDSGKETFSRAARKTLRMILLWGFGYVGMWLMKWALAAAVLQENVLPYITAHVQERIGGDIGLSRWRYVTGALVRNLRCLFPLEYGTAGILAAMALLMFVSYAGYVYQKKQPDRKRIALYLAIGMIPYVRYALLHNHAYLHCFFTYRAQMATIAAVVLILEELTEWRWLIHGTAGKRKP